MTEFKSTHIGIFLSAVHSAMDSTGHRPSRTIISSALLKEIIGEAGLDLKLFPTTDGGEGGWLLSYPVRVVESTHLFTVSFDQETA